jgi:coniferyl-aldehyde dehydrogenase
MHAATRRNAAVAARSRQTRLDALFDLVHDNGERFVEAIAADFGHRSAHETRLLELFPSLEAVRHTRSHFAGWMKPQSKSPSIWFRPGRAKIRDAAAGRGGHHRALELPAVPRHLAHGRSACCRQPGNGQDVGIHTAHRRTAGQPGDTLFRPGGRQRGARRRDSRCRFARLPFDHLLFTGSTKVGHDIMRMAAENLTPVTLELGGKSPAIRGGGLPAGKAAERIVVGKLLNAGQTCIAPDYVLVPAGREQAFVEAARAVVAKCWPELGARPITPPSSMSATTSACRAMSRMHASGARSVEPLSNGTARCRAPPPPAAGPAGRQ